MVSTIAELKAGINALIDEFQSSQTPPPPPPPAPEYIVTLIDTVNGIFKVTKNYNSSQYGSVTNSKHSIELFDSNGASLLNQVTGVNIGTDANNMPGANLLPSESGVGYYSPVADEYFVQLCFDGTQIPSQFTGGKFYWFDEYANGYSTTGNLSIETAPPPPPPPPAPKYTVKSVGLQSFSGQDYPLIQVIKNYDEGGLIQINENTYHRVVLTSNDTPLEVKGFRAGLASDSLSDVTEGCLDHNGLPAVGCYRVPTKTVTTSNPDDNGIRVADTYFLQVIWDLSQKAIDEINASGVAFAAYDSYENGLVEDSEVFNLDNLSNG